jgi:hypothetical protein
MLPTDAHCDYMSKLNLIQNALQKVKVHLSHEEAAMVFSELESELIMAYKLRRKKKEESVNTANNTARDARNAGH